MTHFWLSHTLAVLSQEPLSKNPNLPDASAHTERKKQNKTKLLVLDFLYDK
jgi:hypothetical protein